MRTQIKVIFGLAALFFLAERCECGSAKNFTDAVNYAAPTNFFMLDYSSENYSAPFTIGGSTIEYDHDPNSSISFDLSLACYSIGEGKAYKFLSAAPSDLKNDFDKFYRDKFTNMPPATIGKTAGLTSVSSSAVTPPSVLGTCYFYSSWIQIQTNIVVKVTASSCDPEVFKALTNSLHSLTIDKNTILRQVTDQKQLRPQY